MPVHVRVGVGLDCRSSDAVELLPENRLGAALEPPSAATAVKIRQLVKG